SGMMDLYQLVWSLSFRRVCEEESLRSGCASERFLAPLGMTIILPGQIVNLHQARPTSHARPLLQTDVMQIDAAVGRRLPILHAHGTGLQFFRQYEEDSRRFLIDQGLRLIIGLTARFFVGLNLPGLNEFIHSFVVIAGEVATAIG